MAPAAVGSSPITHPIEFEKEHRMCYQQDAGAYTLYPVDSCARILYTSYLERVKYFSNRKFG